MMSCCITLGQWFRFKRAIAITAWPAHLPEDLDVCLICGIFFC